MFIAHSCRYDDPYHLQLTLLLKFGTKITIMLEPHPIFRGKYSTLQLHAHSIPIYSIHVASFPGPIPSFSMLHTDSGSILKR